MSGSVLKLRQYFCRHDFTHVACHRSSMQNLWMCDKCEVFVIQHWGLGIHYKHKTPHIDGWIYKKKDSQ